MEPDGARHSDVGMEPGQRYFLSAKHLPGRPDQGADRELRRSADSSEWVLDPMLFQ